MRHPFFVIVLAVVASACGQAGVFEPTPVPGLEPAASLALGDRHSCALLDNGNVGCWGDNDAGQLGSGDLVDQTSPSWVPLDGDPIDLATGSHHGCALFDDGTVSCWGEGRNAQLGVEVVCPATGRCPTPPVRIPDIDAAIAIAAGGGTGYDAMNQPVDDVAVSCAIDADESVWCWGVNRSGELGSGGGPGVQRVPAKVVDGDGFPIREIVDLSLGAAHGCALDRAGDVWCWGRGGLGQGGAGNHAARVDGVGAAVDIDAGSSHTCAVRSNGSVWCWGWNLNGQSGDTFDNDYCASADYADCLRAPAPVGRVGSAVKVAAGGRHSCALSAAGEVMCWGSNQVGQLGVDQPGLAVDAGLVGLPEKAVDLDTGDAHSCAVLTSGEVRCWGSNSSSQLGSSQR